VAGSLLGLAFQDSSQPVLASKRGFVTEELVAALESMAYRPGEAKEMVRNAAPRLRTDMTLEEAIRVALQAGKGETGT
jgi:Holliday junction resolvasome RuvABC DNA-binding subunit